MSDADDKAMMSAIRQYVTVQAGGLIEFRALELAVGSDAEVMVLVENREAKTSTSDLSQFIGAAKGIYATPEDADKYIRNERGGWERSDIFGE